MNMDYVRNTLLCHLYSKERSSHLFCEKKQTNYTSSKGLKREAPAVWLLSPCSSMFGDCNERMEQWRRDTLTRFQKHKPRTNINHIWFIEHFEDIVQSA